MSAGWYRPLGLGRWHYFENGVALCGEFEYILPVSLKKAPGNIINTCRKCRRLKEAKDENGQGNP